MDNAALQKVLAARGVYSGHIDGDIGPMSIAGLMRCATVTNASTPLVAALAKAISDVRAAYDITTPLRLIHFLAQACTETDHWNTLVEYGGKDYFKKYDARADLGNTQPGDGYRFRGRGLSQLTGRNNYLKYGPKVAVDLIADPDRAAEAALSTLIMATYWQEHNCNSAADADDLEAVTRKINGGVNGISDRRSCLTRLKTVWSIK